MISKIFFSYLNKSLPKNINYMDLSNLCLTLFFTLDVLPKKYQSLELNREILSIVFSELCLKRKIIEYPSKASFHSTHDRGHWLEILASVLKLNTKPNIEEAKMILLKS